MGWRYQTVKTGVRMPTAERNPLEMIFHDIGRAIEAKFYYHAIVISLSIPDICAALTCNPKSICVTSKDYIAWCETNLEPKFSSFTAVDCYRLRCGVVHWGNFGHPKARYDKIVFTLPTKLKMAEGRIGNDDTGLVLTLDCVTFCARMISAAREWLRTKTEDVNVQTNLQSIVRLRPQGISFSVLTLKGVPVIA